METELDAYRPSVTRSVPISPRIRELDAYTMFNLWYLLATATLGALALSIYIFKFLRFIYIYVGPSWINKYRHGEKPAWALVTGASAGIGQALARELAHRGFNVVLHGRNKAKLEGVRDTIAKEFPERSFRIVIADASLVGKEMITQINALVESLQDIYLTVLINNVGGPPSLDEPLYSLSENRSASNNDAWMAVNARFPLQLTNALLPTLIERQPSLIINIGSMADEGNPWLAVYAGSKAFLMAWSKSLAREMRAEGRKIEVLGIETAKVTGNSSNIEPVSFMVPNATTYAAAVLDRVGCDRLVVNGYWTHGIARAIVTSWLPELVLSWLLEKEMRQVIKEDEARGMKND